MIMAYTLKRKILIFRNNSLWISVETFNKGRIYRMIHCPREKSNLNIIWTTFEHVLDFLLVVGNAYVVISELVFHMIHDQKFYFICFEKALFHYVEDSTWSSYNDVHTRFALLDILSNAGTTWVNFNILILTHRLHNIGNIQGPLPIRSKNDRLCLLTSSIDNMQ